MSKTTLTNCFRRRLDGSLAEEIDPSGDKNKKESHEGAVKVNKMQECQGNGVISLTKRINRIALQAIKWMSINFFSCPD